MDAVALNNLLYEALLANLADGLDSVADRLIPVHDKWMHTGADPTAVEALGTVLVDLGWWRGQIDGVLDLPLPHSG